MKTQQHKPCTVPIFNKFARMTKPKHCGKPATVICDMSTIEPNGKTVVVCIGHAVDIAVFRLARNTPVVPLNTHDIEYLLSAGVSLDDIKTFPDVDQYALAVIIASRLDDNADKARQQYLDKVDENLTKMPLLHHPDTGLMSGMHIAPPAKHALVVAADTTPSDADLQRLADKLSAEVNNEK